VLVKPRLRPPLNLSRQRRFLCPQRIHPGAKPQRIQRADGKGPMAALRTARPARKPIPRPPRRLGQRRIHNLHQFLIALGQAHDGKDNGFGGA